MSKVYFFRGSEYCRYDVKNDATDVDYPKPIAGNWTGLPANGIDAAVNWGNGKIYFFSSGQYYRFDTKNDRVDAGYPKPIWDGKVGWNGLTTDRIDAAVNWGNGKIYLFRGDKYWRYDMAKDQTDPNYPKSIVANWKGLFAANLEAAINWGNGKAYFFKGNQYSRYDLKTDKVEVGWPKLIQAEWAGLFTKNVRAPVMLGYAGIDRSEYPGDAMMQQLWSSTNLTWTGFYLAPAPSHPNKSWMTRYAFLRNIGWGIAPIYVGQQQPEPNSPGSHNVNAAQGFIDAADAVMLATNAGIPLGSVLYLDIETGGPIQPGLADYYRSWTQGVITGGFRPGLYCSYLLAKQFYNMDRRPVFWTFNINLFPTGPTSIYQPPLPAPEPAFSTIEFATVWQFAQNVVLRLKNGQSLAPVDLNSSSVRDPSRVS